MLDRILISAGLAFSLTCLLGAAPASASVKCPCNNGSIGHAMGADSDDYDADDACDDACSVAGGGRVWDPRAPARRR
jgi:hypothetical protein